MYRDRVKQVFPNDYPMMVWLSNALDDGARKLFDLGGHVGISYYADQPFLRYPPELSWRVCDVPAVAQAGRRLAARRDQFHQLDFTERFEEAQPFLSDLEHLGYEVLDKWESLEKRCNIAFEPDYSLDKYFGAAP
jgi:hypothetical protein